MLFAFMIIVFLLLLLLDIAAIHWGADSRDTVESPKSGHVIRNSGYK